MLDLVETLPEDRFGATLAGRIFRPDRRGPCVVALREDGVFDLSAVFPTMAHLTEGPDPAAALRSAAGERVGHLDAILANTPVSSRDPSRPWLLAPIDLHVIKAAGVTFAASMIERVIEERTRGKPEAAAEIRREIEALCGNDLRRLKPGSAEAARLKQALVAQDAWSQYLEVGIGPDAEIFTKAPVLSAVGTGMDAGFHSMSTWNNPEPEVVLAVSSRGTIVGASLGNDVNLRDVEGRSALLLGKAKDNTASCAVGPFLRLFDEGFSFDHVCRMSVTMTIAGADGYRLTDVSDLRQISRHPADLVAQMVNENHQYPDGAALFLGAMFAPTQDRDVPGFGFTHKPGDVVTIRSPELGSLVNRMRHSSDCEPWTFGLRDLMHNLAQRGLL